MPLNHPCPLLRKIYDMLLDEWYADQHFDSPVLDQLRQIERGCGAYTLLAAVNFMTMKTLEENQILFSDAMKMIDSDECHTFEIHCRMLTDNGYKYNRYYSDYAEENEGATPSLFVSTTDNYGSFWLTINKDKMYQIVKPDGEPL